jgi:hypothetical protein
MKQTPFWGSVDISFVDFEMDLGASDSVLIFLH